MFQLIQFTEKFFCHPYSFIFYCFPLKQILFLRKRFFICVFTSVIVKISSLSQVANIAASIFTGKFTGICTGTLGPINSFTLSLFT